MTIRAFDLEFAIPLVREAVTPFPKAAMFELRDDGFDSLFEQLIACMLSIRTYDEVSIEAARRLFARANTPPLMCELDEAELTSLIQPVTFAERKAHQILAIANSVVAEHCGELPCDAEVLLAFSGIGPKCTNLALGIACGQPRISVDIHVHRVTNRWGLVEASTPEKSLIALELVLPEKYWIEINALLVPFGKHICTGVKPKCSSCVLREMCPKIGVTSFR